MADYKRMVSYMYQYENGVKRKNVGYARVEAKNGECKITLHMQLLGLLDSIFPIYMIQRKKGDMELVYIGDAVLKNQTLDSRLAAKETNIMNSGYSLSEMGGILMFLNDNVFYATEWDDKPVILSEVMEALKPKSEERGKNNSPPGQERTEVIQQVSSDTLETDQAEAEEELIVPLYKLPRGWKTIELQHPNEGKKPVNPWDAVERMSNLIAEQEDNIPSGNREEPQTEMQHNVGPVGNTGAGQEAVPKPTPQAGPMPQAGPVPKAGPMPQARPTPQAGPVPNLFGMPQTGYDTIPEMDQRSESGGGTEIGRTPEERMNETESPLATKIFESYPRIYPFEDNEITMCVKIEPKDIGYLPAEAWVLSNNSFLLHGFYCYNHLILAKRKDRNGYCYILGVPGIYHNRERFMARMFGFDCFKSIRKRELRQGDFGYWYVPVSL